MVGRKYDGEQDRRHRPRVMVSVPFRMYSNGRGLLLHSRTLDLSTSGAFLHCAPQLRIGQSIRLDFPRGRTRNPLAVSAEVVRIAEPDTARQLHGVAVRFKDISAVDERILERLISDARG